MRTLEDLLNQREILCQEIDKAMKRQFPLGGSVQWTLGEHLQRGTVTMHGWERLRVVNHQSGKQFWINLHRVELR